jgi:molybdopterin converting factor small subunit
MQSKVLAPTTYAPHRNAMSLPQDPVTPVAVLRLFAAAREAAGTGRDTVPGATVDEVLAAARARYDERFSAVLADSRVWLNGEPVTGSEAVADDDEVAVLPPVSGGA